MGGGGGGGGGGGRGEASAMSGAEADAVSPAELAAGVPAHEPAAHEAVVQVAPAQQPPAPTAPPPSQKPAQEDDSRPWALRLGEQASPPLPLTRPPHLCFTQEWPCTGEYLQRRAAGESESKEVEPWAVRLGTYLSKKKPGPWSLIANEKPQDPLVRCSRSPKEWMIFTEHAKLALLC